MNSKNEYLQSLRDMMDQWETFIASLDEARRTAPDLPEQWSIKDVLAHLMAWQQVTNARLDAALSGRAPAYPDWFTPAVEAVEEEGGSQDQTNARIFNTYHAQTWPAVYRAWQSGFQRIIDSVSALPEADLLQPGRYTWLGAYPLAAVLDGTLDHHREHREWLEKAQ